MAFNARFTGGDCEECGHLIRKDQLIEGDGVAGYRHVVCPEQVDLTPRAMCPTCFLELPNTGVCDDCS